MTSENNNVKEPTAPEEAVANPFTGSDVEAILRERGWISNVATITPEQNAWCERAAALLGPRCADRTSLADLLGLVFRYDAADLMTQMDTHVIMSRRDARDVLRQLGRLVLEPHPFTSERFKEIVTSLKESLDIQGRELFHPLRLALAGRVGEGNLDRVILLVDEAAGAGFATNVKTVRQRALEFCAALD
jgi:nondiscriminating glutamyl-tRNA synthetase